MNNDELDRLLKSVPRPSWEESYWKTFPGRVANRLARSSGNPAVGSSSASWFSFRLAWGLGFAVVCVLAGFGIGFWRGREAGVSTRQLAGLRKYYTEIESMFPGQLKAIVFDQHGPRLILSERPNVPKSTPFHIRIWSERGCEDIITFSGQAIQVDGEKFEVLANPAGDVMLVGNNRVWSERIPTGGNRMEAMPLSANL